MAALQCCVQPGGEYSTRWIYGSHVQRPVVTAHRSSTVTRGLAGLEVRQEIIELPPCGPIGIAFAVAAGEQHAVDGQGPTHAPTDR
jgi:hypothetical protein